MMVTPEARALYEKLTGGDIDREPDRSTVRLVCELARPASEVEKKEDKSSSGGEGVG